MRKPLDRRCSDVAMSADERASARWTNSESILVFKIIAMPAPLTYEE
ncbi:hypothetical protein OU994_30770 [Pseudoduganella sp. SL102]|nr:hypothetical protein [Pseudoduganella sp. SL102]WBS05914.1 hypothetical protein OU994_30770 [Pseudoduganella sp. SL102]